MTEKPKLRKISCIFSQHFQITLLAIKDMKSKSLFVRPILHKPKRIESSTASFLDKGGMHKCAPPRRVTIAQKPDRRPE